MAKQTLSFSEIVHEGTIGGSRTLEGVAETLYYGDYVSLNFQNGHKLEITSFGDIEDIYVFLKSDNISGVDAGTMVAQLTHDHPTLSEVTVTVDGNEVSISSADFYIAVDSKDKDKKIGYNIHGTTTTASSASQEQDGDTILYSEETTLSVDSTTYVTPVELDKGDKIVLVPTESQGVTTYFLIYKGTTYTGGGTLVQMSESGYTAQTDDELVMIVAGEIYTEGFTCKYKVIRAHEATQDTILPNTGVYNSGKTIELKEGDELTNATTDASIVLVDPIAMKKIATIEGEESYVAGKDFVAFLCGEDANTELTYTINDAHPLYEVEYTGASGIFCFHRKPEGKLRFYLEAGDGYMEVEPTSDAQGMRFLNMAYINKVKFVSESQVISACVNTSSSSSYSDDTTIGTF